MGRWAQVKVKIRREAVEAVTALFLDLGAGGVVLDDDDADAPFLIAYWADDEQLQGRLRRLREGLAGLPAHGLPAEAGDVDVTWVEEEDWAHGWKAHFRPQPVGSRLLIRPTWDADGDGEGAHGEAAHGEPAHGGQGRGPGTERITIWLDPGMAFGTGHHPTTRLCLELLEQWVTPGTGVADVGTGSGILAIAAARLGAGRVVAVDVDPNAVKVAEANAAVNGVEEHVVFAPGSASRALELAGGPVPLVVANITADVLIFLKDDLAKLVAPEGRLVVSGIVVQKWDGVVAAYASLGFAVEEERRDDDWVAAVLKRAEKRSDDGNGEAMA